MTHSRSHQRNRPSRAAVRPTEWTRSIDDSSSSHISPERGSSLPSRSFPTSFGLALYSTSRGRYRPSLPMQNLQNNGQKSFGEHSFSLSESLSESDRLPSLASCFVLFVLLQETALSLPTRERSYWRDRPVAALKACRITFRITLRIRKYARCQNQPQNQRKTSLCLRAGKRSSMSRVLTSRRGKSFELLV
jgi:hypothetical protein